MLRRHLAQVSFVGSFLLVCIFLRIYSHVPFSSSFSNTPFERPSHHSSPPSPQEPFNITITETGGSHDEVVAALIHSFGSQPNVQLSIYQLLSRFQISDIISSFNLPSGPVPKSRSPSVFEQEESIPDILVLGTCELDVVRFEQKLDFLFELNRTYLYCVVHHADRWAPSVEGRPEGEGERLEGIVQPWVGVGRIEFLTLSPHTKRFFEEESIPKWRNIGGKKPVVRYFVPVFPVEIPEVDEELDEELGFALQGDYDPTRRDYTSLFHRLETFLTDQAAQNSLHISPKKLVMHLLGHGDHKPSVPGNIKPHIQFNENLNYLDYYTLLSKSFALLPAFASKDYLDRKASSSVPASLIAGVPLVTKKEVLDAYGYLKEDVVWLQEEEVGEMDIIKEVLGMGEEVVRKRKLAVRKLAREIVEGNAKRVGEWVREGRERMKR